VSHFSKIKKPSKNFLRNCVQEIKVLLPVFAF
jgi:hypothetical protein